jgi:hypothetical protein
MAEENGFSFRVRLGDILTMAMVLMTSASILGSVLFTYIKLDERVTILETKVDLNTQTTKESSPLNK